MAEYRKSLAEWVRRVIRAWVFFIPGLLAGGLWVAQAIHPFLVSKGWTIGLAAAALLGASFVAFHRVRVERDSGLTLEELSARPVIYKNQIDGLLQELAGLGGADRESDQLRNLVTRAVTVIRAARGDGAANQFQRVVMPGSAVNTTAIREQLEAEMRGADAAVFVDGWSG